MAVDEATKKQDELELYQIDDKAIVPFFQKHLEELRQFIHDHQQNNLCLLVLLKQFIRTYRMPFNMQRYMEVQRTFIQRSLHDKIQDRQQAVSHWIQEFAGRHRNRMIQLQCLYLDRVKDRLLPEIEKMLENRIDHLQEKLDGLQTEHTQSAPQESNAPASESHDSTNP
jgi:DNA-binding transcriptional regulator YbjK